MICLTLYSDYASIFLTCATLVNMFVVFQADYLTL
jgi:hypothetical protein